MDFISKKFIKGFSLIELMVVIGIMGVIATISIFNYSKFNNDLSVTNLAYEIALTIREAQVFGGSVKVTNAGSFDKAYGIYVSKDTSKNKEIISFVDTNSNDLYDPGGTGCLGECVAIYKLERGNIVSDICRVSDSSGFINCSPNNPDTHITFLRPNLDAKIKLPNPNPSFVGVRITLEAPDGTERYIRVLNTGQISVELP